MRLALLALLILPILAVPAQAQVSPWTSAQTSANVIDLTMDFGSSTNRNGSALRIGNNASTTVFWRVAVNFTDSIADSIYDTVDSCKVSFTATSETFSAGDSIQVYPLTQTWSETGASFNNKDTGVPWTGGGGGGTLGPLLHTFDANTGAVRFTIRLDSWAQSLADGATQYGILLKRKEENIVRFADWVSDAGTEASRVQVVIWSHDAPSDGPPDPVTAVLGFEDQRIGLNAPPKIGIEP